jgi:predicted nucleotide-binding protein
VVFLVHGTNHQIRDKIDLYLTKDLGLDTIVMEAGPNRGRTLPEKFEEIAAKASFAIFIMTADDRLQDRNTGQPEDRPRQNVILEAGYFWGALGRRGHIAFLVESTPSLKLPSDIQGLGWIPITEDLAEAKLQLRKELEAAEII